MQRSGKAKPVHVGQVFPSAPIASNTWGMRAMLWHWKWPASEKRPTGWDTSQSGACPAKRDAYDNRENALKALGFLTAHPPGDEIRDQILADNFAAASQAKLAWPTLSETHQKVAPPQPEPAVVPKCEVK
jgi:hypothetical protein